MIAPESFAQGRSREIEKPGLCQWGSKLLTGIRAKGKAKKKSPRQINLWEEWNTPIEEIHQVAEKFVLANCFEPRNQRPRRFFENLRGLGGKSWR